MDEAPFNAEAGARQWRTRAAPMRVWLRASLLALSISGGVVGYLTFIHTPIQSTSDTAEFGKRIESLQADSGALRRAGQDPLKVVFIGTSRTKNIAFEPDVVRRAARNAGLDRPVVSNFLAVNWGGFQRLEHAVDKLAEARPDYAIVMPELLYEDYANGSRLRFALRYLQQWFWRQDYTLFDVEGEFETSACRGFDYPVEQRARDHYRWMRVHIDGPGPTAAAQALRKLATVAGEIYVAEIPVHPRLAALQQHKIAARQALALHGLDRISNIKPFNGPADLPDSVFCDFVHFAPEHAESWLGPLFRKIAAER